jgi:actin-related protein 5
MFSHCKVALDYNVRVEECDALFNQYDITVQFPYTQINEQISKEEEEIKMEKRREQGRRLKEQQDKMRIQKLQMKQNELSELQEIHQNYTSGNTNKKEFISALKRKGIADETALQSALKTLEEWIIKTNNRIAGIIPEPAIKEAPSFHLLEVPDTELNEDELKEKRIQKLMKANYDARERQKIEKEKAKALQKEKEERDEEERQANPQQWLELKHSRRQEILDMINEKKKSKEQLQNRRSQASKNRLKNISEMAIEKKTPKKRRRNEKIDEDDDDFGMNDDDWMIYREISKSEDEEEEEYVYELEEIEALLEKHDPNFSYEEAYVDKSDTLIHKFMHGTEVEENIENSIAESYQMHLNIERIRVPEVLFQPSIIGVDQAGLVELITGALGRYSLEDQNAMAQVILKDQSDLECLYYRRTYLSRACFKD